MGVGPFFGLAYHGNKEDLAQGEASELPSVLFHHREALEVTLAPQGRHQPAALKGLDYAPGSIIIQPLFLGIFCREA